MVCAKPELILHSYFHKENAKSVVINFEVQSRNRLISKLAIYRRPAQEQPIFASILEDVPKKNQIDIVAVGDFHVDQLKPSCALTSLPNPMKSHFITTV